MDWIGLDCWSKLQPKQAMVSLTHMIVKSVHGQNHCPHVDKAASGEAPDSFGSHERQNKARPFYNVQNVRICPKSQSSLVGNGDNVLVRVICGSMCRLFVIKDNAVCAQAFAPPNVGTVSQILVGGTFALFKAQTGGLFVAGWLVLLFAFVFATATLFL